MLQCLAERNSYGDETFIDCHENLTQTTAVSLADGKVFYHQDCYKSVINKTNTSRLKARCEKLRITMPIRGRPPLEAITPDMPLPTTYEISSTETKTLRSKGAFFDKSYCIICQKPGGKLHKVAYTSTGCNMVNIAQQLTDQFCL